MSRDDASKTTKPRTRSKETTALDPAPKQASDNRGPSTRAATRAPSKATPGKGGTSGAPDKPPAGGKRASASDRARSPDMPSEREYREPTHDEIAQRAYRYWRESGGGAMENWTRAERDLKGER